MSFTRAALGAVLLSIAAWPLAAGAREKSDVVLLTNGDRITGEIVQLQYGQLKVKTDNIGTIYVEWPSVAALESRFEFLVEQIGGRRAYGRLLSKDGALVVSDRLGDQRVLLPEVVTIGQAENDFWERVSGSASIGATYAKGTDTGSGSASLDAIYRSRTHIAQLQSSWNRNSDSNGDTTDRWRVAYQQAQVRPKARYWIGLASVESNEELGLKARAQVGGAISWRFHERTDSVANFYSGLVLNEEWRIGDVQSETNVEALFGLGWQIYRFATPETTLSSTFELYPNLTDTGRVRARTDVSLKRKFGGDFTLQLQFYDDYDNRPPGDGSIPTNDYGFTTSLGYTF